MRLSQDADLSGSAEDMDWDRNGESGAAAPAALLILLLLSALAGAAALSIEAATAPLKKAADRAEARAQALDAALAILPLLETSAEDGVDSRDLFASLPRVEGVEILVDDVSSRLNPNLLRKTLMERTELSRYLAPGATPDSLQQAREDSGLALDIFAAYGDFFDAKAMERLFTPYSYGSVNTDDEFALRKLYFEATGDEAAAEVFHTSLQAQLTAKELLKPEGLEARYGLALKALSPLIGAEPQLNANFADAEVLSLVLSYPNFEIASPQALGAALAQAAKAGPLDQARLASLSGLPAEHPVWYWIGTRTWFWRLVLKTEAGAWRAIVRMEPGALGGKAKAILCEFAELGEDDDRLRRYD